MIDQNVKNADISTVFRDGKLYLTEDMLYDFMLEARTEGCKAFRKWVTSEVLPSIRANGGYIHLQQHQNKHINKYIEPTRAILS